MPLIHRDSVRGGGSQENHNFDPAQFAKEASVPQADFANGQMTAWSSIPEVVQSPPSLGPQGQSSAWPSSPEEAQSLQSLVPQEQSSALPSSPEVAQSLQALVPQGQSSAWPSSPEVTQSPRSLGPQGQSSAWPSSPEEAQSLQSLVPQKQSSALPSSPEVAQSLQALMPQGQSSAWPSSLEVTQSPRSLGPQAPQSSAWSISSGVTQRPRSLVLQGQRSAWPSSPEVAQGSRSLVHQGQSYAWPSSPEVAQSLGSLGSQKQSSAWPSSPEVAQSPRSLVPSDCFPSRDHPAATYRLCPDSWSNEASIRRRSISDLAECFKALVVPPPAPQPAGPVLRRSPSQPRPRATQARLSFDLKYESWSAQAHGSAAPQTQANRDAVSRRASFCDGVNRSRDHRLVWCGKLVPRCTSSNPPGGFSAKIFLGGLPWDISEDALMNALRDYHPVRVEWPGSDAAPRGFAYVTLESEQYVRAMLHAARRVDGKWVFRVSAYNLRTKDVEVIPWAVSDSNWVYSEGGDSSGEGVTSSLRLESNRTVFVGALHGILSAAALAKIMNEIFPGVIYAGIDTDKNKYPIGSGRVTFNNAHSYLRAIAEEFIEIRTDKFSKKIQVDPYLEDAMCSSCNLRQGPYFCRDPRCFSYFCRTCWGLQHSTGEHKSLMRTSKSIILNSCIRCHCSGNTNDLSGNGHGNCHGRNGNGHGGNSFGGNGNGNGTGHDYGGKDGPGPRRAGYASEQLGTQLNGTTFADTRATPSSASTGRSAECVGEEQLALEWNPHVCRERNPFK